uniref:ABC transporter domain-containing protein n=1 Tax=Brassica oleracea var. oleracea TaxID=109376 RepID=A0A0D3A9Y0_BRAOL
MSGSPIAADKDNYADPGLAPGLPIYSIQPLCSASSTWPFSLEKIQTDVNNELFKGSYRGNPAGITNEIAAAYDLMSTDKKNFNVTIWYNSTYKDEFSTGPVKLVRVPRSINLISNAYLKFLKGPGLRILCEFVKEVPKHATRLNTDIASLLGPLFFTWVVLLLFPVILTSLVYEKQERLRIMMKMHGLGDGPYWLISYAYFLTISVLYVASLVIFGSVIGLKYFRLNSYSIQFVFYFIYLNLQMAIRFLVSSNILKVVAYILVYGTGLLGSFLFQTMLENQSFLEEWIFALELYPGFSLYRGLYEFSQYASRGNGMKWQDLSDSGMGEVLCIMSIEWFLALIIAFYIDQVFSSGKHPFFFLNPFKKSSSIPSKPTVQRVDSKKVSIDMGKIDVSQEREKVQQLRNEGSAGHAILCDNLKRVYPGECFGMLGPNGAGKTSFISMMTGLLKPSSGTALVQGLDICKEMNKVYTSMGVCPQHDLLWETLTGREHLLFYGRLKNIKGSALTQAVEESLKSVSLFDGGVGDKPAGNYSGGMKKRLSVAISLIGNPKVVYLDEPSTGLDPASRKNLWDVIQRAKQNTAIILTNGALQCIGNSKELNSRYGGSYVFTMTTSLEHEEDVERLVSTVSPNVKKVYHLAGRQKFELPKQEVRIAEVFWAVEKAKSNFTVFAWGLADTTLEDVFIKVAKSAQAFISLS